MSRGKTIEKVWTSRALIIGVIYCTIILFWYTLTEHLYMQVSFDSCWPYGVGFSGGSWMTNFIGLMWFAFIPSFVSAILPERYKLTTSEIVLITSMTMAVLFLGGVGTRAWANMTLFMYPGFTNPTYKADVMKYLCDYCFPKDQAVIDQLGKIMVNGIGNPPVPWGAWMTPLIFWIAFTFVMQFFFIFSAALLRHQYVDVEALAFPYSTVATNNVIKEAERSDGRARIFKNKLLWIGVLITVLTEHNMIISWFYWTWTGSGVSYWYDFNSAGITNTMSVAIFFIPWLIALGLILPRPVTISAFFGQLIMYMILPAGILIPMGIYTPFPLSTAGAIHMTIDGYGVPSWHQVVTQFYFGILFGAAIVPTVMHSRTLIRSLKMALSGQDAREEALSYRYLWLGWGLTALGLIGFWMLMRIPIDWVLVLLIWWGVWTLGRARIQAEGSWWGHGQGFVQHGMNVEISGVMTALGMTTNREAIFNMYPFFKAYVGMHSINTHFAGGGLQYNLEGYNMARLTNTSNKAIFTSQVIGMIIVTVIIFPVHLYLAYQWGWGYHGLANALWGVSDQIDLGTGMAIYWANANDLPLNVASLIVGGAFVAVVAVLRARFGGIFTWISPIGIYLAGVDYRIWFPFLVAFIIRTIVVKVGGARLYEERVMPLAAGMLLGMGILAMVGTVACAYKGLSGI